MAEPDAIAKWTDRKVADIEKDLAEVYKNAQEDLTKQWNAYMKRGEKRLTKLYNAYKSASPQDAAEALKKYQKAVENYTFKNEWYQAMIDHTTTELANVNKTALAYVNGELPAVYARNWQAVGEDLIEVGLDSRFTVLPEDTVRRMVLNGDIKTPFMESPKFLDIPKDKRWNTKQINSSVLQGIIQGENMDKIAKRLLPIVDRNEKAAMRNARTLVTGAQNAGRLDSYKKLRDDGAVLNKVWMATGDGRTRDWHLDMDGQEVGLDEAFIDGNGEELEYPGDPGGPPESVYNCRCTMHTKIIGFRRADGSISYIDYDEGELATSHDAEIAEERAKRVKEHKKFTTQTAIIDNTDNLPSEVIDILGSKGEPISPEELLKNINPNFNDENYKYSEYHWNCQRCSACYELGRRGYNVEALPWNDEHFASESTIFNFNGYRNDDTYLNKYNEKYKINRSPKTVSDSIIKAMTDWGDGARASLSVTWRGGDSSHIVNVESINGRITIFDAQCGQKYTNIEGYLSQTKCANTELLRLDTAPFREGNFNFDSLKTLCKKRGK